MFVDFVPLLTLALAPSFLRACSSSTAECSEVPSFIMLALMEAVPLFPAGSRREPPSMAIVRLTMGISFWEMPATLMPLERVVLHIDGMLVCGAFARYAVPVSGEILARHRAAKTPTNEAWNYGYGKHGKVLDAFISGLTAELDNQGIRYFIPTKDPSFKIEQHPVMSGGKEDVHYSTSWSNRHVAFAAGLGTFGVHRHLITEKGCGGVLASMILDCELEPTPSGVSFQLP